MAIKYSSIKDNKEIIMQKKNNNITDIEAIPSGADQGKNLFAKIV
tara:strand:+ start:335 stop:469 length:135 start_codon:yes stop_codon:yes gene_type:complete